MPSMIHSRLCPAVPDDIPITKMAKSKNGGAFQFLRGSIGSVTFSTSTMNVAGVRQQIARQKVTSVNNPNTIAQILQRMKIAPAQRFFAAINNVDATRLLEHSWESLRYGNTGRLEFLRRALKADGPYVPKGATRFVPAEYEISDGSLREVKCDRLSNNGFLVVDVVSAGTPKEFITNAAAGDENAQVTILKVTLRTDGTYQPTIARFIPAEMADGAIEDFPLTFDSQSNLFRAGSFDVALAVIVSKKDVSGAWLRSPSKMVVSWALYNSLYSTEAMTSAVSSYQAGGANELGSDWYLNLALGQPFGGSLGTRSVDSSALTGAKVITGAQGTPNGIEISVFTVNGQAAGQAVVLAEGQCTIVNGVTATTLTDLMDYDYVVQWTPAMASQIGYPMSAALIAALQPEEEERP